MTPTTSRTLKPRKTGTLKRKLRHPFPTHTYTPTPSKPTFDIEETQEMVRFRELQGNRDGYGFIHANPTQVVQRLTPGARDLLGHLRLLDFLTNLTHDMDIDLVITARVSFDQERKSISIMGPGPDPIELFLSTRLLSQALGILEGGQFIRKIEKTRDKCEPYFQGLVGKNKDRYPLEKS